MGSSSRVVNPDPEKSRDWADPDPERFSGLDFGDFRIFFFGIGPKKKIAKKIQKCDRNSLFNKQYCFSL